MGFVLVIASLYGCWERRRREVIEWFYGLTSLALPTISTSFGFFIHSADFRGDQFLVLITGSKQMATSCVM